MSPAALEITIRQQAKIAVVTHAEREHPKHHFDDETMVHQIVKAYDEGNEWAWCTVEVRVSFEGIEVSEYLGACSFDSENDFKTSGYYLDMVTEAIEQIAAQLRRCAEIVPKFEGKIWIDWIGAPSLH